MTSNHSKGNSSSDDGPGGGSAPPDERSRLTEEEKKQNHIMSEQKRRQAIREGFDRLTELVPGLEGQGRSEGLVLKKTVAFMREQLAENERLKAEIRGVGASVPEYAPPGSGGSSNKRRHHHHGSK